MSITSNESVGFLARMSQLELRLKESEDERFKLEEKFNQLLGSSKLEESKQLFQLRANYCQLLERDRIRCERNDLILRTLNQIENRTSMLTAKTDRLRLLKQYYESYMDRHCSSLKRSDLKYSNFLGSMNDLNETSASLRPASPSMSLFSSSPLPLFTSTPSTTRRSSLVVPDLDLPSLKFKSAPEMNNSSIPTRRKLFGNSMQIKPSLNNGQKSYSNAYTENTEAAQSTLNVKSKDFTKGGKLSPSTTDFEQSTYNDLLDLSLNDDDEPNCLLNNKNNNSLKVETVKPKSNCLSNLHIPINEYERNSSILGDNKSEKTTPRTAAKPLTKSCSFSAASSYLNRPDSLFSTERRSNLIRKPTFAYRSTISPQLTQGSFSSKSPLKVVDDIFKKYLINYDKRYLSDPISESKYGKYLYPSRNYELSDNKFPSVKEEGSSQHLLNPNYTDPKQVNNKKVLYRSSKESFYSNQFESYKCHEPVNQCTSKSNFSGYNNMDSPRSTYSNDWKDWGHYRNRYEYTADDNVRTFNTLSSQSLVECEKYPKFANKTTYEDQHSVPEIYVDSLNIDYLGKMDPYYKPFNYQRSTYPSKDQNLSEKRNDNYASLGVETESPPDQSLKRKDSTKMPQTPKKVSFSNEFLYDDGFDLETDSFVDVSISQDTDNNYSKSAQNIDFIQSNDFKTNENPVSYQNEGKDAGLENKTNSSDPSLESSVRNREQYLTSPNILDNGLVESELDSLKETDSSINSKNQTAKESMASTNKLVNRFDQNVTEFSKPGMESTRNIEEPTVLDSGPKGDVCDKNSPNQIISNEFQDAKLGSLQEREVADTSKVFNKDTILSEEQSYHHESKAVGDQGNLIDNSNETPTVKKYLSEEKPIESSVTDEINDLAENGSLHQTYDDVVSQLAQNRYEENKTDNSNLEGHQEMEQNLLHGDVNAKQNKNQDNDYVDQSHQDKMAFGDTSLSQYNSNYEQIPFEPSQLKYEKQVTKEYNDDNYTGQSAPEYDQNQGAYTTEPYNHENVPESYQKLPEAYDSQYTESLYEQPVNYDTESYRQNYDQPVGEQYHQTDYQQENCVKDEEHIPSSHYQSEPNREYNTEQYQEEYPQQPVNYEKDYQHPLDDSKQQFDSNYDPAYQKDPQYIYDNPETVYDPTVPPEQYDQYDQQPYPQYEGEPQQLFDQYNKQPQLYDQYDQQPEEYDEYKQQPQQYDQPSEVYDEYKQQQYDQQPEVYDEYKQQPQMYNQSPEVYDKYKQPPEPHDPQSEVYDEYKQQPQQYDQPLEAYDEYEQQPQQYMPYEQEHQQEPPDQFQQRDPGNYDQYEHQQKEQYESQYQGEPDQFGNYDYSYGEQNLKTDHLYRGDEQLAYTNQPQTYDDNIEQPQAALQEYDQSAQLPYVENVQASYEEPQQTFSEGQVKYGDETHSYVDLNQDSGVRPYQEPLLQTSDTALRTSDSGKTVPESMYNSGAEQVYRETADSKIVPNLSRMLESDPESICTPDPQEAHENSSDFDFSLAQK